MNLIVATNNQGKLQEIRDFFSDPEFLIEPCEIKVTEDGTTYQENAKKKVLAAIGAIHELSLHAGKICLADDSGLEIAALNGEPGIHSARYISKDLTAIQRNEIILERLKDVPKEKRKARFRCVIALAYSEEDIICVEGICPGEIAWEPRGENGFGYDPIFLLPTLGKTFAELSKKEKNKLSHRCIALKKIKKVLHYYQKKNKLPF